MGKIGQVTQPRSENIEKGFLVGSVSLPDLIF